MLNTPTGGFALFVGQLGNNSSSFPFEVWVNGTDQPCGLGAIIHRYAMLGVLDERGYPTREMGILESPRDDSEPKLMQGTLCAECGNHTVIRKDGCDFCTACGAVGTCG